MAKYARDVNKQIKIIDVQKQFPGGLKTVDTDDALGKVYLREVENISLSEFSFIEKRYGISQEEFAQFSEQFPGVQYIQGYFEYTKDDGGIDKLLFADGKVYLKQSTQNVFNRVQSFISEFERNYRYPTQAALETVFDVEVYSIEQGAMVSPRVDVISESETTLFLEIVNRDFQSAGAQVFYSVNNGAYIDLGVMTPQQKIELSNIPVPTAQTDTVIKAYAVDPQEERDDSAINTFTYKQFRSITATFNVSGGTPTIAPITVFTSADLFVEAPQTPTKEGNTFLGWNPNLPAVISEDTTFVAEFAVNPYTISFETFDGSFVNPQTYNFGATTVVPTPPTRTNFFFAGWFTDEQLNNEFTFGGTMPANNFTLYAKWFQTTLRMRSLGRYLDAITSNVAIPQGVQIAASVPGQNPSSPTLTSSFTTLSTSITPGAGGGEFVAPETITRTAAGGATVEWTFLRWDITIGSTNYTFNNRTLPNPFTPTTGGSGNINLYTADLTSISVLYSADRPNYPLTLSTNKTVNLNGLIIQDRNNLPPVNDPNDPKRTIQFIGNFNTTLQIPEGNGFFLTPPVPEVNWSFNGWFRMDTNQRINPLGIPALNEPILPIGSAGIDDTIFENNQASFPYPLEARYFSPGPKVHPALTITQSYNSSTKELQFRIRNLGISDYPLIDDYPPSEFTPGQRFTATLIVDIYKGIISPSSGLPLFTGDNVFGKGLFINIEGGYDSNIGQFGSSDAPSLRIDNIQPGEVYGLMARIEVVRVWLPTEGGSFVSNVIPFGGGIRYPEDPNDYAIVYARRSQTLLSSILT